MGGRGRGRLRKGKTEEGERELTWRLSGSERGEGHGLPNGERAWWAKESLAPDAVGSRSSGRGVSRHSCARGTSEGTSTLRLAEVTLQARRGQGATRPPPLAARCPTSPACGGGRLSTPDYPHRRLSTRRPLPLLPRSLFFRGVPATFVRVYVAPAKRCAGRSMHKT